MEWPDILERIEAGEGRNTELKRGAGDLEAIGKAICAFANTEGGVVILGVDDSGTIVGVKEDPDKLHERLTGFLQTGCSAPVSARCGRHEDPNGWVHWMEVPRQRGYEPLRYRGREWVRRERSNAEPSPAERQELYNTFGYVLTEEQVVLAAEPGDIDHAAFRKYLHALDLDTETDPQPTTEDDLRNRGVLAERDGALHATLYGLMAFGKEPQRFPQTGSFFVQCVAYSGGDRAADVASAGESKGQLDEQVRHALGWVRSLGRMERYEQLVREDVPLVPVGALREALVNAVVHRDYAIVGSQVLLEIFRDRIDVTSPGTLPNQMTEQSVRSGGHPRSRNESMANFMLAKGLMEKRGRGWPVMRAAMRAFNGTEPELVHDKDSAFVRVTFLLEAE